MILETRHLELMAAVADHGTLTHACRELNCTQSALSHQLLNLESRLRTRLFNRVGRRMIPTAAGLRLVAAARGALPQLKAAEDSVRKMVEGKSGTVRISTECYTSYHWLPAVLRRVEHRVPGVEVDIVPDATRRPLEALLDGRIDVGILMTELSDRRFRVRPLFRDELVGVVCRDHPLASRPYLKPQDFAAEHLLMYSMPKEENMALAQFLAPAGVHPAKVTPVQLTEAIIEMVRAGLGVATLADWAVKPEIDRGEVVAVRLGARGLHRTWNAVTLRSEKPEPHIEAFIQALAEEPTLKTARSDVLYAPERGRPRKKPRKAA